MLEIGGTAEFISGLEVAKGDRDGKLPGSVPAGSETVGTLLVTEAGKVSEDNEADGAGGKVDGGFVDGKEMDTALAELELAGIKPEGNSGKFEDPVGKGGLKLGYCICCCIDEGIDKPGGGRSKDCWCKLGIPFGAP